jgi:hypothetical protein
MGFWWKCGKKMVKNLGMEKNMGIVLNRTSYWLDGNNLL